MGAMVRGGLVFFLFSFFYSTSPTVHEVGRGKGLGTRGQGDKGEEGKEKNRICNVIIQVLYMPGYPAGP